MLVVEDDVMSDLPIAQDEKDSQIKSLLVCMSFGILYFLPRLSLWTTVSRLSHAYLTH
jgi:hypothetical protein